MGKSLGNVLDPVALVEAYGADAVRFFFLKEVDFGQVGQPWQQSCQSLLPVFYAYCICLNHTFAGSPLRTLAVCVCIDLSLLWQE